MKRIALFFACLMLGLSSLAQVPLRYSEVVPVVGVSADDIFFSAQKWVASVVDARSVTTLEEKTMLIAHMSVPTYHVLLGVTDTESYIDFLLTIECRDGRYKIDIDSAQLTVVLLYMNNPRGIFGFLTDAEKFEGKLPVGNISRGHANKLWRKAQSMFGEYATLLMKSLEAAIITDQSADDLW